MRYYIYRMKYEEYIKRTNQDEIPNLMDNADLKDGDSVVVIVSKSLVIIGAYTYQAATNSYILKQKIGKVVTEFYDALPMVSFVNEKTYKLFSKKLREIDKENYEVFIK